MPKIPAAGVLDFRVLNDDVVNLMGICPKCESVMHRCVRISNFEEFVEKTRITFPQPLRHLIEIDQPSVDSDLKGDV